MYISVHNLKKSFNVKVRDKGLKKAIKTFLKPKYRRINAVDDISFDIEKGEIVRIHWTKWCWKKYNYKNALWNSLSR